MDNAGLESGDYLRVYVNSSVEAWQLLLDTNSNAAEFHSFNITKNITMTTGVYVRFAAFSNANNDKINLDNINITSYETVSDTTPPDITINSPINSTIGPDVDYDITVDEDLHTAFFSVDNGANNTLDNDTNTHYFNSSGNHPSLSNGFHNITFWVNDTAGNANESTIFFTVDAILPTIDFVAPTPANGSTQPGNIYVNITSSDSNDHYAFVDFNNSLFLWMRMDDVNSTGNPTDLSSEANNGTLFGDASIFLDGGGRFGSDAEFDGVDESPPDAINVSGLNSDSRFNESFSASVWVNLKSIGVTRDIIGTVTVAAAGWKLGVTNNERIRFQGSNGTSDVLAQTGNNFITADSWFHVVGVYNKSVPDMKLYVNGMLEATITTNVPFNGMANSLNFLIGMTTATNSVWNGSIDEVLLFNRSLSLNEIIALNATGQLEHNFSSLTNGTYTFTGYAVDMAGNKNQTEERTVIIEVAGGGETIAPIINSISDSPDPVTQGNLIDIEANITDNTAVDSATLQIDSTNYSMYQRGVTQERNLYPNAEGSGNGWESCDDWDTCLDTATLVNFGDGTAEDKVITTLNFRMLHTDIEQTGLPNDTIINNVTYTVVIATNTAASGEGFKFHVTDCDGFHVNLGGVVETNSTFQTFSR